jgi:hypothetical protein
MFVASSDGCAMSRTGAIFKEGWLVVRMRPWEVRGVFADRAEAAAAQKRAGAEFEVKWGGMPVRADPLPARAKPAPQQAAYAGDKPKARGKR